MVAHNASLQLRRAISIRAGGKGYLKSSLSRRQLQGFVMRRRIKRASGACSLSCEVPVFRRWGKKFFIAVDQQFFKALPPMKRVPDIENSEVTWVLYDFKRRDEGARFSMSPAEFYCTEWADVEVALREGVPPKQQEILDDVYAAMTRKNRPLVAIDV